MNLHVAESGLLVPAVPTGRRDHAPTWGFDDGELELAIESCINMSDEDYARRSAAARRRFETMQSQFALGLSRLLTI
jgi:hypothetical protein